VLTEWHASGKVSPAVVEETRAEREAGSELEIWEICFGQLVNLGIGDTDDRRRNLLVVADDDHLLGEVKQHQRI
jgi:hypothetical protein